MVLMVEEAWQRRPAAHPDDGGTYASPGSGRLAYILEIVDPPAADPPSPWKDSPPSKLADPPEEEDESSLNVVKSVAMVT